MAEKPPRVSRVRLVRASERTGWYIARQDGSHAEMKWPGRPGAVRVPIHKSKPAPPGTLRRNPDDTGIAVARLKELP